MRRREIAEQLQYARSLGDLSENAEYEEARNLQAATEDRIRVIEENLSHARIIERTKGSTVSLGSTVTIQKQGEKEEHTYQIVGSAEANMQDHKISHLSPLGSSLMERRGTPSHSTLPRAHRNTRSWELNSFQWSAFSFQ